MIDRASRLSEVLPVETRSDAEIALELQRVVAIESRLAAYKAGLVLGLAAHRPDTDADERSPVPGTSEFFVDELAVVCNSSARAAERLAGESWVLVERLPVVWAALADGELDWARARVFLDVLGSTADGVAEAVSAEVLPQAAGLSLGRLRAALQRAALAADAAFAEEKWQLAERQSDVRLYPTDAGMAAFTAELPAPLAAACWSTVDELAWMVKNDGDVRPIGQLRAGVLADLILRPWDGTRPAVTANLTIVAPLPSLAAAAEPGAEPAEVDGLPITAAHVRELLTQLDAVCPGGLQAPTGGSLQVAVTNANGALLATASRRDLERIDRHGCGKHPAAPDCGCAVLERPPPVDRYRPTPAQRRFGKTRDRTCRQPNCGQPVGRVDLDHVIPYPEGPTDCDNLCCLCRRHHRLKTHAPGWRFVLTCDGRLRVTTPSGVTRITRPPGLRDRIEQRALPAPPPPPEEPPPF